MAPHRMFVGVLVAMVFLELKVPGDRTPVSQRWGNRADHRTVSTLSAENLRLVDSDESFFWLWWLENAFKLFCCHSIYLMSVLCGICRPSEQQSKSLCVCACECKCKCARVSERERILIWENRPLTWAQVAEEDDATLLLYRGWVVLKSNWEFMERCESLSDKFESLTDGQTVTMVAWWSKCLTNIKVWVSAFPKGTRL